MLSLKHAWVLLFAISTLKKNKLKGNSQFAPENSFINRVL